MGRKSLPSNQARVIYPNSISRWSEWAATKATLSCGPLFKLSVRFSRHWNTDGIISSGWRAAVQPLPPGCWWTGSALSTCWLGFDHQTWGNVSPSTSPVLWPWNCDYTGQPAASKIHQHFLVLSLCAGMCYFILIGTSLMLSRWLSRKQKLGLKWLALTTKPHFTFVIIRPILKMFKERADLSTKTLEYSCEVSVIFCYHETRAGHVHFNKARKRLSTIYWM